MPHFFLRRRGLPAHVTQVAFRDEEKLRAAFDALPENAHSLTDEVGEVHEDLDVGLGYHSKPEVMLRRCERHRWRLIQAQGAEVFLLGMLALRKGVRGTFAGLFGLAAVESILLLDTLSFGILLERGPKCK